MNGLLVRKRLKVGIATGMVAAATSIGVVLIPGASGAASGPVASSNGSSAPLAEDFALLRTAPGETIPATVAQAAERPPADYGLQASGIRAAKADNVWLIPGEGHLCIAVNDPDGLGMSCSPAANAEQGQLAFVEHSSDDATTVIGVAPDGVTTASGLTSDGSVVTSTAVQESNYVLSGKGISEVTLSPGQGLDPLEVR
jgi:hypothetical protein